MFSRKINQQTIQEAQNALATLYNVIREDLFDKLVHQVKKSQKGLKRAPIPLLSSLRICVAECIKLSYPIQYYS